MAVGTGRAKQVSNGTNEVWRTIAMAALSFALGGAVSLYISTVNNQALAAQIVAVSTKLDKQIERLDARIALHEREPGHSGRMATDTRVETMEKALLRIEAKIDRYHSGGDDE